MSGNIGLGLLWLGIGLSTSYESLTGGEAPPIWFTAMAFLVLAFYHFRLALRK